MGSQSSSGMSGGRGSSSGNPADQPEGAESNQSSSSSSSRGRRTADRQQGDRQQGDRQPASEEDVDLAEVLAYLLRRGQVRLVHGSGATGLQLVQSYSDSDEDSDGAWEGRLGNRYNPPVDAQPDTHEVDQSEIRTQIMLATGSSTLKGRHSFTHMLTEREQGRCRGSSFSHGECSRIRTHFLPNYVSHKDTYQQKAFCGVYSENGNMFLSACQDQNVRLYDTTRGRFHLRRTVKARDVGWSVLDVCFTPDAQNVLYSSWSDYIHMCSIDGDSENHTALDLNPDERRFCVFSLAASTDGNEILGGANDGCLYVFDLEQNKRTLKIDAHEDDVNAVAFADSSSQLLFSGSDDALCKVWDRRTLREDRPQPVGQLAGHRDGITFIHSKVGGGRREEYCWYFINLSKTSSPKPHGVTPTRYRNLFSNSEIHQALGRPKVLAHKEVKQSPPSSPSKLGLPLAAGSQRALKRHKLTGDTSVMTYRGHGVLHTLVRCRFSPEFSTGQRFIYSGCSTGKIIIYDVLTGSVVSRLSGHDACVRDVSWHPYEDNIVSSSWDGAVRMWEHRQTHPLEEERERERV
ncbi:DDB1- and CUL4-associated factor 11 [Perca fluviatilis]|uniref:DDB1- and CUL4-associated factor 11 n=1 Tax=Perca fluviatilis TaxID=8168 RepID=UPI001963E95F|nr:DDB1- and CUL4-associated factor 11 [Perca fluviatilis]